MSSIKALLTLANRFWRFMQIPFFGTLAWISGIGLWEFAFTDRWYPGFCQPISPPWDSLIHWFQSGMKQPISEYFNRREIIRFSATSVTLVLLMGLLGWAIRDAWPIRLRVRTLMLSVAFIAIGLVGNDKIWSMWGRWDHYSLMAGHFSELEEICRSSVSSTPLDPEEAEMERKFLAGYRTNKLKYEYLMWRPWISVDQAPE